MAVQTPPTADALCTESMKMAGIDRPSPEQVKRAKEIWLQQILSSIWMESERTGNTRLKTLHTTAIAISVDNQRVYDLPSNFDEELEITILESTHTGSAQSGTNASVVLASDEDISQGDAEGRYILMTGGASKGQYREIISYDTATVTATPHRNFDNAKTPASGDTYGIVDQRTELKEFNIVELGELSSATTPGRPTRFAKHKRQFYFDKPFDAATYGLLLRYYANIHKIDLTEGEGTLMTQILTDWQDILYTGVQWKAQQSIHDSSWKETYALFKDMLNNLIEKEIPYGGEMMQFTV